MTLTEKLDIFLKSIPIEALAEESNYQSIGQGIGQTIELLKIYANEARAALGFVSPFLVKGNRILEVGAGLCLLSFFLKQEGYDIVALEPTAAGFNFFSRFQGALTNHFQKTNLQILRICAEELQEEQAGRFSLIFSYNVLEHAQNPIQVLNALLEVMENQGKMVHSCPNYLVPYEPHFSLPVLNIYPKLTKLLFREKIAKKQELWDSLNFITYPQVMKFSRQHNLNLYFEQGLLYSALSRLNDDPIFRRRQGNKLLLPLLRILVFTKIIVLLKHLPPVIATPMNFVISRK